MFDASPTTIAAALAKAGAASDEQSLAWRPAGRSGGDSDVEIHLDEDGPVMNTDRDAGEDGTASPR